jgi:hypothetical protein
MAELFGEAGYVGCVFWLGEKVWCVIGGSGWSWVYTNPFVGGGLVSGILKVNDAEGEVSLVWRPWVGGWVLVGALGGWV